MSLALVQRGPLTSFDTPWFGRQICVMSTSFLISIKFHTFLKATSLYLMQIFVHVWVHICYTYMCLHAHLLFEHICMHTRTPYNIHIWVCDMGMFGAGAAGPGSTCQVDGDLFLADAGRVWPRWGPVMTKIVVFIILLTTFVKG